MENWNSFLKQLTSIDVKQITPFEEKRTEGVFVGCGLWPEPGEWLPANRLLLNNKGTSPRFGRSYSSVTAMIVSPPPGLLETSPLWSNRPVDPQTALQRMTLVVEDASPDSLFGVLLLLASLAGIGPTRFPRAWIEAVDLWEREGVAEDPWTSWCPLESALAHSYFPVAAKVTEEALAKAWTAGLRFVAFCLVQKLSPHAISDLPDCAQWRQARMALAQEEQVYLDWLPHATALQLSLPLSHAPDRRVLVDALAFTEDQSTGAAKVFYRNDKVRAPLQQGFTLAAHHRPAEQGTGDDFTVAVDPRRGVHLRDLWYELERCENDAWQKTGEVRPSHPVRPLEGVESHSTQPWYVNPEATLIGAPRRLPSGQLGTRLTWRDMLDAIWTVFNPLRDVKICPSGSEERPIPLLDLQPHDTSSSGADRSSLEHHKCLLLASWPRLQSATGGVGPRSLSDAPIVPRVLAAMVNRGHSSYRIGLEHLALPGSWEKIALSAGFGVVTENGLFVLDDWTPVRLHLNEIVRAFNEVATLENGLRRFENDRIKVLMRDIKDLLARTKVMPERRKDATPKRPRSGEVEKLLCDVANAGSKLSELRGQFAGLPHDSDGRVLRDALDKRWGVDRRLRYLEEEIESVEGSLRSLDELRSLRLTRFATIFAFPVVLATGAADPFSRALWWTWTRLSPHSTEGPTDAPAWLTLGCFLFLAFAVSWVMQWWQKREDPLQETNK